MPTLIQRSFLFFAIMAAMMAHVLPAEAEMSSGTYKFSILSSGITVGSHISTFTPQGRELVIDTTIKASLTILFVKLFEYSHYSREVWRDGKFADFRSETLDDGQVKYVHVYAASDGIHVDGSNGSYLAPPTAYMASLWNPAVLKATQLIHVEHGRLEEVRTSLVGTEIVRDHEGREVEAEHYQLVGRRPMDLWYGLADKTLDKLRVTIRGREIEYLAVPVAAEDRRSANSGSTRR